MNKIRFIRTMNTVTAVADGKSYIMNSGSPNFKQVIDALTRGNLAKAVQLFDLGEAITKFTKKIVTVKNGVVMYGDKPVHNVVASRIIEYMSARKPAKYLILFLEKLLKNTDVKVQEQLYPFLEHENIPIDNDGDILAYKSVRPDWKDWHTGTVLNTIGTVVKMDKNKVDSNPNIGCSVGYHAGSWKYAFDFNNSPGRHIVIVKINPVNVGSVPTDCSHQKIRCSEYTVTAEVHADDQPLTEMAYIIKDNLLKTPNKPVRDAKGRFVKKS